MALEQFDENQPRKVPSPDEVFGSKKVPSPSDVFGDDLKKKESTPLKSSVTPLPYPSRYFEKQDDKKFGYWDQLKVDRGYKPAFQTSPIASAVKKDTQKDESLAAGIYNTLVGSVKRLAGGAAYTGEVLFGGRPEATITRLASAENARQKTEQFVEKARSEKASKQYEESMGKYDFTPKPGGGLLSGVDADDFKALAFTAPSQALDMVLGGLTYGSSFVAQSVSDAANELNQSDSGKKLNDAQKAAYIFTQAAVQAALEKVSLDLILKNTGLGKKAKQKIANEITDEFLQKGIKATADDIEKAAIKKASTFANVAKRVGIKTAAGIATEGTTEGTQTAAQEGIKLLTNKIVDNDVFDEEDIIANLGKNIINASVGGAAFGGVAGGGVGAFQNTNKAIRDEVAKAGKKYFVNDTEVSEAEFNAATGNKKVVSDITKIQDEISKQVEEGNITPQEAEAANITAQQYAEIAGKIPTTVSPQDKYKIIGGIEQRETLNAKKQQAYDELTTLDPVFRKEKQDQIDLLQAKIDETNDYLEGIVSGKKPEYKEKRGMYFKVDSEGNETPINKETYDLAKSIREEDERKAKEPVDTTPNVIMPDENAAPEVVEPTRPAVIMPEENVPAETTVISPEQQAKGAAVVMPEANVAPEVAEKVVTQEEVVPTAAKPEVKSKLDSFKTKFAPQPKELSMKGISASETRKINEEAKNVEPKDARGFALSWLATGDESISPDSLNKLLGSFRASLNVGKSRKTQEEALRDYVNKEGQEIDKVADKIWDRLPEQMQNNFTSMDIRDQLEMVIAEYSTRKDAAKALIEYQKGTKGGQTIEEQRAAYEERTQPVEEGVEPVEIKSGFVPFVEGEEELPFAVQEATTEEVAAMQDIVKDYIDNGTTSLSEIKKAIAKELGYNTKKLRQTIEDAYNKYTTTAEAAVTEVKSGLLGRVGNAFGKMFDKEAQKPFIAKDGKALDAKAKNVAETGGRVSFQATLGDDQNITVKPVDASVVNGFYSPLELQINQMKQDKMPAKQWLDKLRSEEAKWTGLSDWLSQQEGSLTKENIKNWLQDNQIEINEIVKGDPDFNNKSLWEYRAIGDGKWTYKLKGRSVFFQIDASEGDNNARLYVIDSGGENEIGLINYSDRDQILDMALERNTFESYIDDYDLNTTKYSKYTLEGEKEDYKEILITYPTPPKDLTFEKWNTNRMSWGEKEGTLEEYKKAGILYRSNHFDERNILVHVRSDIRTDSKGNKIYFIEEVQSDWGQEGKKKGFYDLTDNELKRFNELKPVMPILSDAHQNAHQAFFYAYKYDVSTSLEEFYKLPVQERKNKINETHNKYQERTNNYIASLQKGIDDRNKQISDNIDNGLLLEEEELKYDKALRNAKNNKVVIDGKEIDLNIKKEYDAYNNKLKQLNEEIKDLNRESVKLEEENGIYSKQIDNLNKDKEFDDSEYIFAIKNSELTFDKNEYDKITNEFNKLEDKIKVASINKAPFVTKTNDWAKLGLKVALKNAVEAGASKIAWTNGEQQNERYDLSKQVSYIKKIEQSDINKENNQFQVDISFPTGMINLFVNKDTNKIDYYLGSRIGDLAGKDLSDVIGKDMADKVIEGDAKKYEGDGLKIGGKGMKGFYGSPKENSLGILGDLAKSLYKQTPDKLILDNYREEKLKSLQAELDEYSANKTSDFRMRDFYLEEAQGQTDKEEKELMLLKVDYHEKRAKNNAELEESVLREIKRLGIEYQYSINITPELKAQVEVGLPLFMANPSGADILGFSFANRMYLNGEKLNPNTIIHEAGHIWTEWVKNNDYNIYAKGMELVEKSPYLQKAKNSKFYQEQAAKLATEQEKEEYFKHEALAMAIGDKGAQFVVESKKESFKDWLKTLWNKIKSLTGFKDLTEEQFQNLTFEEFSKMAVKEILGVENDLDKFQAARSMKKKKDFVKSKVRGEANKNAIDDFEVDDMIKLIKADYDLQTLKNIKNAIQERSAEEVLPSKPSKVREPRGERKRVEPAVEWDEVTGEGEAAPTEGVEKEWEGAITIAANEERRQMLGLPEYQRKKESFEQWTNDAIKAIKRGYDVEKLLDKMAKGYSPTPAENQIRKIYIAKLKSDYGKNPSAELERKFIKYTELNDLANSAAGRQLRSIADVAEPRETLADFVVAKMKAVGVDELTEKQRKQVEKQYQEIKEKEAESQAKFETNDELNAKLLAEETIKNEKKARKPYQKTKDYKAERSSILESIREKLKKARSGEELTFVPVPYAKELIAISPDVTKLMKLYIEEGVDTLAEVVSKIYVDLRDEVDGLVEKDIFDIIAGRYSKERPALSEAQVKRAELKKEADLIAQIEDVLSGQEPKQEKAKIEKNQRLTQLRNQLKDLKKESGYYDLSKLQSLKESNDKKIKELDEKIKNGEFEKELKAPSFLENPEFKKKYPKEYDAYLDSVNELADKQHEFELALVQDEMKKTPLVTKIFKKWIPEVGNTIKALLSTIDDSFIFVQLGPAILKNPLLLPKVLNEQRKVIFNEGRFRREIAALHEDKELWNIIQKSGLDILDPRSLRDKLREESMGGTNLLEREIGVGKLKVVPAKFINAPFERIATSAGNYVRTKMFLQKIAELEKEGKTIENSEKEYQDVARVINEMTGRGKLHKKLEGKGDLISAFLWSPKMLASTINLLGLGDIGNFILGGKKGYYGSLSPEMRKYAAGQFAGAIGMGALIMTAFALDDDFEVDYDPRSVTFGQIKHIPSGDAWNIFGRFTSVVRFVTLMATGVKYIRSEAVPVEYGKEVYKFIRGKAAPAPGLVTDMVLRQKFNGEPFDYRDLPKEALTPLAVRDIKDALIEDGTMGLLTKGIPAFMGIKVMTEKMYNQAKQPLEDVIKKHARTEAYTLKIELKDPKTKEIATDNQYDDYVKKRDELITEKITDLYNGYVITDSPNPVPFVSLEAEDANKEISRIKSEATKEAKDYVFGVKKKTAMERRIERLKRKFRR